MPRYFFDVNDGQMVSDTDGRDLPDDGGAQRHAIRLALSIAGSDEAFEAREATVVVTARNASHQTVATVRLVMDLASAATPALSAA